MIHVTDLPDLEDVARQVHEEWMAAKILVGTRSRSSEWGEELMVPYNQLSQRARELDRITVRTVYRAIVNAARAAERGGA